MSEKLVPSDESADGNALTVPEFVTIVILSSVQSASLIEPVWPFPVVYEPWKLTVPKLASGSTEHVMKHEEGASATHSADVRAALEDVCWVENVAPVVRLLIVSVNVEPFADTSAAMVFPG